MDDGFIPMFAAILVISAIVGAITKTFVLSPGRNLRRKFQKLGNLTGQRLSVICALAGEPNSKTAMQGDRMLYQWQTTGYHISLLFEDGVCVAMQHESFSR